MTSDSRQLLRYIPSIDKLLGESIATTLVDRYGRQSVASTYRATVTACRDSLLTKSSSNDHEHQQLLQCQSTDDFSTLIHQLTEEQLNQTAQASLKPVINATGTVLHTNLGRALLPDVAIEAIRTIAAQPSNLEFDLTNGKRGDRDSHVMDLICELTGAEAATVVNNNAAAVLLALNSVAETGSVAVSRGELVEIGGSFRIPDVMKKANCHLIEVGTTNRTHLKDFEAAIDQGANAIMRVHTSNYRIDGFTATVEEHELARLCQENNIAFLNDLGSGVLVDLTQFGLPPEPTVKEAILAGADIVTFSGDKLLGGPQCGILVGTKHWIDKVRKNPLKRALRTDKHTLAALEALLRLYRNPEKLTHAIPAMRYITRLTTDINATAKALLPAVSDHFGSHCDVTIESCASQIGSGALPVQNLDSVAITIKPLTESSASDSNSRETTSVDAIATALRALPIPVIGRIHRGAVWLDMRCIENTEQFTANLAQNVSQAHK